MHHNSLPMRLLLSLANRTLALGVATALTFGVTAAYGIWSEPTNPPGEASVTGAVTTSPFYQARGALSAKDVRVDDMERWMSGMWQFKPLGGPGLGGEPYTLHQVTAATLPQSYANWQTTTINPESAAYQAMNSAPGEAPRRTRALRIRVSCREAYVWLFAPGAPNAQSPQSPSSFNENLLTNGTYAPYTACAAENDDWDIQTVTLPVSQASAGGPIQLRYRILATDSGGDQLSAAIQIVGMYYTHD